MPRNDSRDPDPIVGDLGNGGVDVADVISLVGFVGPGPGESVRIRPDMSGQRYLEVPAIVHRVALEPENPLTRSRVWVDREMMIEPLFANPDGSNDGRLESAVSALGDVPFSVWNLIPETRLVAASMLDLIPYDDE